MTNNKILVELRQKILEGFPKNMPLACIYLTAHRCDECDGLRDDFCGKKWWEVSVDLVNKNYDKLSLFTPPAYHYYLPSFLLHALDAFFDDNLVIQFVIYSLGPPGEEPTGRFFRERRTFFSELQRSLIRDFLKSIINDKEMNDFHLGSERALNEFWQEQ